MAEWTYIDTGDVIDENDDVVACIVQRAHGELLAAAPSLLDALHKCIRQFENMDENLPTDAGCIECTAGTVPNNLNTGLCGYHAAKAVVHALTGRALGADTATVTP